MKKLILLSILFIVISCSSAKPITYIVHHSASTLGKETQTKTKIQAFTFSKYGDSIFFNSVDINKKIKKTGFDCSKIIKIQNESSGKEYQGCELQPY